MENSKRVSKASSKERIETRPPAEAAGAHEFTSSTAGSDGGGIMASSVTRHAQITERIVEDGGIVAKLLLCGVDTLDVGLYVKWLYGWNQLQREFEVHKSAAEGKEAVPWRHFGPCEAVFYPSGKPPQYRYHFQIPMVGHFFVGKSRKAHKSPNVYASLSAEAIWNGGVENVGSILNEVIKQLDGQIDSSKVSRCDLCADFLIRGGLTDRFIREHRVSHSDKQSFHADGNRLETYYLGSKRSPIQLRIYDKAKEIHEKSKKFWFKELWGVDELEDIWRVEFQLRRTALKQFGIEGTETLKVKLPGLWRHLTTEWFSLRIRDDSNTSRQSFHPWWFQVQECAGEFGQWMPVSRVQRATRPQDISQLASMVAGYLVSYAAATGQTNPSRAWKSLRREVFDTKVIVEFNERYAVRRAKLGWPTLEQDPPQKADKDEVPF